MADITSLINTSLTIIKGILETKTGIKDAALKNQISEVYLELAEAKTKAADLMTENKMLKAELEERNNNPLQYNGLIYTDTKNELYCPACYDEHQKRIHLTVRTEGRITPLYRCPVCRANFEEDTAPRLARMYQPLG